MKKGQRLNKHKMPVVAVDPSLNQYGDKTLFPEKLALANEQLKDAKLPAKKHYGSTTSGNGGLK